MAAHAVWPTFINVLRDLIGDCEIEELPISFTAVATDLDSGQAVWLRQGKLFDAIRASMATPLVFTPVRHGDRTLLDGAVVDPVPVAPTIDDATDLTIAVDLGGPLESRPLPPNGASLTSNGRYRQRILRFVESVCPRRGAREPSLGPLDVAFSSMQTQQDTIAHLRLSACPPDVLVQIPRNACGFFEFWRADELIELGRERVADAVSSAMPQGQRRAPAASHSVQPSALALRAVPRRFCQPDACSAGDQHR